MWVNGRHGIVSFRAGTVQVAALIARRRPRLACVVCFEPSFQQKKMDTVLGGNDLFGRVFLHTPIVRLCIAIVQDVRALSRSASKQASKQANSKDVLRPLRALREIEFLMDYGCS